MTPISTFTIRRLPHVDEAAIAGLAKVLVDCVEAGASVGFMQPFAADRAAAFWRGVAAGVARGERALLVAETAAGEIVGTTQLVLAQPENQPHRADVAKMLVRRDARRQGIAAALLRELDAVAAAEGKWLLVLDTVTGGDAERLYPRLGWQRCGVIPDYAFWPGGGLCDTTVFFRKLR